MQYLLTEEEYNQMVPRDVHNNMIKDMVTSNSELKSTINLLKAKVMENRPCYDRGNTSAYCDGCPLGFENLGLCTAKETNYSK